MQFDFEPTDVIDPVNSGAVGPDVRPAPPERLSPSGAATFDQCPRRWRFRYVERMPDPPGIDALVGTFAHRVLELLMQQVPGRRTKTRPAVSPEPSGPRCRAVRITGTWS